MLYVSGDRCEECAINHYGNPLVANGTCTSCLEGCNYSIDMEIPGSCDADTGRCLKCQYDTEGDSCERCAKGFHGNAVEHSCVGTYIIIGCEIISLSISMLWVSNIFGINVGMGKNGAQGFVMLNSLFCC